jgi:APA family basic amino acid/polyamine antiporter
MAVPVMATPDGPQTALGDAYIKAPVLGVVQNFDPGWLADVLQWAVLAVAVPVLVWAANTSMLGLSRHTYVLATNRQIPSWLGKLQSARSTPYVAIVLAGLLALGLALPADIKFLAGVYAFGALLAITIAHLSVIRLRYTDPERGRPYRVPMTVGRMPLPALIGATVSALGWLGVFIVHGPALYVGGSWMLFGLVAYLIYRRYVEGTSLTKRVTVPELALKKRSEEVEFTSILVPVFGTELDDDIVATAGRLADAEVEEGELNAKLEVIFVPEMPLTVPLNAPLPPPMRDRADRALARATEIGDEYENVDVSTAVVPARSVGAGIVEEARRSGAEVIVMGAEPPTRVRGGAILGGIGAARPEEIGKVTEYVLGKAPCRVLLTAPPEETGPSADTETSHGSSRRD